MGWPQWVLIILMGVELLGVAHLHGTPRKPYEFWGVLVDTAIMTFLLWKGGFFG